MPGLNLSFVQIDLAFANLDVSTFRLFTEARFGLPHGELFWDKSLKTFRVLKCSH